MTTKKFAALDAGRVIAVLSARDCLLALHCTPQFGMTLAEEGKERLTGVVGGAILARGGGRSHGSAAA